MIISEIFKENTDASVSYSVEYRSTYGIVLCINYSQPLSTGHGTFTGLRDMSIIRSHLYTDFLGQQYVQSDCMNIEIAMAFIDIFKKYDLDAQYNGLYIIMTREMYEKLIFLVKTYDGKLI